jgi:hypothetical protein
VNLADFIAESLSEVQEFEAYWKANNERDPEMFPMLMNPGEWFEQFLTFVSTDRAAHGAD